MQRAPGTTGTQESYTPSPPCGGLARPPHWLLVGALGGTFNIFLPRCFLEGQATPGFPGTPACTSRPGMSAGHGQHAAPSRHPGSFLDKQHHSAPPRLHGEQAGHAATTKHTFFFSFHELFLLPSLLPEPEETINRRGRPGFFPREQDYAGTNIRAGEPGGPWHVQLSSPHLLRPSWGLGPGTEEPEVVAAGMGLA